VSIDWISLALGLCCGGVIAAVATFVAFAWWIGGMFR